MTTLCHLSVTGSELAVLLKEPYQRKSMTEMNSIMVCALEFGIAYCSTSPEEWNVRVCSVILKNICKSLILKCLIRSTEK